jgi:hypothetical protein
MEEQLSLFQNNEDEEQAKWDAEDTQRRLWCVAQASNVAVAMPGFISPKEITTMVRDFYLFLVSEDPIVDVFVENSENVVSIEEWEQRNG